MAAAIWQQHPRYTAFVALGLFLTLYMLYSHPSGPVPTNSKTSGFVLQDPTLSSRLRAAEKVYDATLEQRKELIKKYGPTPKDIEIFPDRNKEPHLPYVVWDFFPPTFTCPHEVQRLGILGNGGKYVCGLSRLVDKPDCVVYSFGIKDESSFEREILDKTNHCQIWGYADGQGGKSFGPEIPRGLAHRTHFKTFGIASYDRLGPGYSPNRYKLPNFMKQNGHDFIDILKLDIEGMEYEAVMGFILPYIRSKEPMPIGQIQIEVHMYEKTFAEFNDFWELLEEVGLRPFSSETNAVYQNFNGADYRPNLVEYSFINIKGDHILLKDPPSLTLDSN